MPIPLTMNLDSEILQFGGSLVAILLLAGLAHWLGLGAKARINSPEHAKELAGEALYGFDANDCSVDAAGLGAILSDEAGRIMVLKRHGSQFAGRVLTSDSDARHDGDQIVIDSGERRYGAVKLDISNAEYWAKRIEALRDANHA